MYVCLCLGVTDKTIEKTIAEGATSVEEVMYCTGAGTRCGSCQSAICAMVEEAVEEAQEAAPASRSSRRLRVLTTAA